MVHQHFMLVRPFTVAENLTLAHEYTKGPFLDTARAVAEVRALSERHGLRVDPTAKVENLSVGEEQRVEILKALYHGAKILILDEPTAVLTPQETEELFRVLRALKAQGTTVILITHQLREVPDVTDDVTVMRGGKTVGERRPRTRRSPSWPSSWSAARCCSRCRRRPRSPARPCSRSRTSRCSTSAACRRCADCRSTCARARSSASPASRATARASWSRR
jgi:simple sugar transport system ATP-binding protein